jgi:MFS family permease
MMLAGRFFAGMGIGFLGVLAPCEFLLSACSEHMLMFQCISPKLVCISSRDYKASDLHLAHPSNRGRLTATFQLFIGIGAFVAGWIGYGCSQGAAGTQVEWRVPVSRVFYMMHSTLLMVQLALQMLPAVPLVCLTFLLPESPRFDLLPCQMIRSCLIHQMAHDQRTPSRCSQIARPAPLARQHQ